MEQCACVDFNNRCDQHKDLVIGPNLIGGGYEPFSGELMEESPNPQDIRLPEFESGHIPETDAMGREKFWEDLGRPNA